MNVKSLPTLQTNFIPSDVKVTIREYRSNLAKKLLKEVENVLLN